MTSPFSTQYDRIPLRHRDDPEAVEAARVSYICSRATVPVPDWVSPSLADPGLLRGSCIERITTEANRVFIDFGFCFPDEDALEPSAYGGPARLIADHDPVVRCSGTDPAEPDPHDAIVWSELRATPDGDPAELVIVCASGRHLSISAGRIRFATISIAC